MTNEQAIAQVTEAFKTARRNADGSINGNVVFNLSKVLRKTFRINGMEHDAARRAAWAAIREIEKGAA